MSKMDELRAMREARYEQAAARTAKPAATRRPVVPSQADAPASPATVDRRLVRCRRAGDRAGDRGGAVRPPRHQWAHLYP